MNITIDMKFPSLPCSYLTVDAMDVSGDSQTDIAHNLYKTRIDVDGRIIQDEHVKVSLQPLPKVNNASTTVAEEKAETTTLPECESCYGAETAINKCCPTCDDVKAAYRAKGWQFNPAGIHQCVREGKTVGLVDGNNDDSATSDEGCWLHGHLEVNKVAGNFHIAPGQSFEQHHVHVHSLRNVRSGKINTTHYIDELTFGQRFPNQINPLSNTKQIIKPNSHGAILYHYYVKIVPSTYVFLNQTQLVTNQYSVTKHIKVIQNVHDGSDNQLPGTFFTYEISAIMVKFIEQKRSLAQFLTSLCAIIGGVFTVSSLIDAFIYRGSCIIHQKNLDLSK